MLPAHAREILLCLRYGIGDVVMETPLLPALRRAAPEARVTALGASPATEVLEGGEVDRVEDVRRWGFRHRWDRGSEKERRAFGRWFAAAGFDLVLDAHHAPLGVAEAIWSDGVRSLEADEAEERRAVREGAGAARAIAAAAGAGWGMPVPDRPAPRLRLGPEERAFAARFLAGAGLAGAPAPLGVAPCASLRLKRWPPERHAAVLRRVAGDRPVLVFHGPDEEAGEALARAAEGVRTVPVGALHLRRVAALLARCAAALCNDTGLLHLAAAVGTPTVGVFGPTNPRIFRPRAPGALTVAAGTPCPHRARGSLHPPACWSEDRCLLGGEGCIRAVGVAEVADALRTALTARAPDPPSSHLPSWPHPAADAPSPPAGD